MRNHRGGSPEDADGLGAGSRAEPCPRRTRPAGTRSYSLIRRGAAVLLHDRRGVTAIITALTMTVLAGMVGLGLDAAVWYSSQHRINTIAESAALSAARLLGNASNTSAQITQAAKNNALLNGFSSTTDTASVAFGPSGQMPPNATSVTVTVRRTLPRMFSRLFLASDPSVSASATAAYSGGSGGSSTGVCIYVLGNVNQALLVNGGANLNGPNCEIHVLSTQNPAAIFNGNSTLTVAKTCVKGSYVTRNGNPVVGGLKYPCPEVQSNPYVGKLPSPGTTSCTVSNQNYSGTANLSPGTYCGSFNFNGNGTANLAAGLYVFKNARWTVNGGWTVKGTGVTFYFADSASYIQLNGNVTVSLIAPTSGTYANILMYEPDGLTTTGFTINGTASGGHYLQGLVYLPSRNLTLNSNYNGAADAFTLVVNTLIINGSGPGSWSISPAAKSSGGGSSPSPSFVLTN